MSAPWHAGQTWMGRPPAAAFNRAARHDGQCHPDGSKRSNACRPTGTGSSVPQCRHVKVIRPRSYCRGAPQLAQPIISWVIGRSGRALPGVCRCVTLPPMDTKRTRRILLTACGLAAAAGLLPWTTPAAFAQAKAAAESNAAARKNPHWTPPKTAWGHPDLEGIWTTDDMRGVPMSRPPQFGDRMYLTDEEFAARAKQRNTARAVDNARTGTFRNEEGTRDFGYTSMVIDPPDGRVPALTARRGPARGCRAPSASGRGKRSRTSRSTTAASRAGRSDRGCPPCTATAPASCRRPTRWSSATRWCTTRASSLSTTVPTSAPASSCGWATRAAHFEGNTLVIESRNFTDRTAVGGAPHSTNLKLTERLTRVDPEMIDYEIRVEDPDTFVKPFTMRMTVTNQPGYVIYEYGCHEGNNAMRNALSAERAHEKAAAEAAAKGLPPPERVFERVNGADRASLVVGRGASMPNQLNSRTLWLAGVCLVIVFALAVSSAQQRPAAPDVAIDADDIGGVVTGPGGPEAGVWVIAETRDLPVRYIKSVVTDDRGRFVVPDLPKASYTVWARGYGLVDSAKATRAAGPAAHDRRRARAQRGRGGALLPGHLLVLDAEDPDRRSVRRQEQHPGATSRRRRGSAR